MKRKQIWTGLVVMALVAVVILAGRGTRAQEQKKPTAKEKMATMDFLVGSWDCAHTVGPFSGKYTTQYTKPLGDLWLREIYNFPAQQFGGDNSEPVTAEALIGYDGRRGQWVRFFGTSKGEFYPLRMKETANGWVYQYVTFFGNNAERSEADATFTKKSATEYEILGPTYPENGQQVTEHHICHKQ